MIFTTEEKQSFVLGAHGNSKIQARKTHQYGQKTVHGPGFHANILRPHCSPEHCPHKRFFLVGYGETTEDGETNDV